MRRAAFLLPGVVALAIFTLFALNQAPAGQERTAPAPDESALTNPEPDQVRSSSPRKDPRAGAAATTVPGESTDNSEAPTLTDNAYPVRVRVPEIDVNAEIVDLGLNPDGTLEVPQNFDQTGWYTGRSTPGSVGPSVVVGHVDSTNGPAVFFRLRELDVGDTIEIDRSDGLVATFRVSRIEFVDKDEFPTDLVYGHTDEPTLRLITCGGDFDRSARSYESNLLVFAEHTGSRSLVG
ncbi:MAG: class F sortase [Acidobacteria bacterium]|nr:class F sortase [Acidobacteriota bacterium]